MKELIDFLNNYLWIYNYEVEVPTLDELNDIRHFDNKSFMEELLEDAGIDTEADYQEFLIKNKFIKKIEKKQQKSVKVYRKVGKRNSKVDGIIKKYKQEYPNTSISDTKYYHSLYYHAKKIGLTVEDLLLSY